MCHLRRKTFLLGGIISALLIVFIVLRMMLPGMILERFQARVFRHTHGTLSFSRFALKGVMTASFDDLNILSSTGDTILYGKHLEVRPSFWAICRGSLALDRVNINTLSICLNNQFINEVWTIHRAPADSFSGSNRTPLSLHEMISSAVKSFSRFVPSQLFVDSLTVSYLSDTLRPSLSCSTFRMQDDNFYGDVVFSDSQSSSDLIIEGSFPSRNEVSFSVHGKGDVFRFPYVSSRWGISSGFDSLNFRVKYKDQRSGGDALGSFSADSFFLYQKSVSPDTIRVVEGGLDFLLHIRGSELELDSLSQVHLNGFRFSPYVRYQHSPQKTIQLVVPAFRFVAEQLLESLPSGLFPSFFGLKVDGNLKFFLACTIPFNHLDSLRFRSNLESDSFHILKFGVVNPYMLRDSFYHEVYENDRLVAAFPVYAGSTHYTSLDHISGFLTDAVLTSEDGGFFYHRGFNEEAFRDALIINLQKQRFVRGASTITMQLVKNVFLTRQKNISRKLEEVAWVWMIENLRLLSKERMLEVYFNIVEWGPGVYGITDASKFYFNKAPSALTLSECIYLSMLLPRPKQYVYFFNGQGKLKESLAPYYKTVVQIMLRREWISENDTLHLFPDMKLTGPARERLRVDSDTIPDSTLFLPGVKFL